MSKAEEMLALHLHITDMCRHVSKTYWPSLTPEQIESMADCMVEAV